MKSVFLISASIVAFCASPVSAQATGQGSPTDGRGPLPTTQQQVQDNAPGTAPGGAAPLSATEPDAGSSGDIVVTAQRESTLLSKTPVAITAITGAGLRDQGITSARDLANYTPNVAIAEAGDAVRISIRGVSSTDSTEKGDPSAAYLIDGIYIARPSDTLGSFFDVQRVEVLRGPQGTLYGRNATAGVINVISNRPSDRFEGSVDGFYGNLNHQNVTGVVNIPLTSTIALRAAGNYDRENNFVTKGVSSDVPLNPSRKVYAGRVSLGGKLGALDFVLRGDYTKQQGTFTNSVPISNFFNPLVPTVDPLYVDRGNAVQRALPYAEQYRHGRDNDIWGITGELSYDLGFAQASYVGSYRQSTRHDTRNLLLYSVLQSPATFDGDFHQQSHEVRLAFGRGSPLHGQVGGYFFRETSAVELLLGLPVAGLIVPGARASGLSQDPTISRSIAGFGQVTYDLTSRFHVTGGVRYTTDRKERQGTNFADFSSIAAIPATLAANCSGTRCTLNLNSASRSFNKITWKGGVDYDVPDVGLLYASVSTGYKAGGFNDGCIEGQGVGCTLTASQLYFEPETLTSYEAGFKLSLMGGAARINGSGFHYDYSNLQINQIVSVNGLPQGLSRNAAAAKINGGELEAILRPDQNNRIDLSFTYNDAHYTSLLASALFGTTVLTRDFAGRPLDQSPRVTWAAGYTHTIPLGNGAKLEAQARTRFSDSYVLQDLNNLSFFRQPSFTKTDVNLTYTAPGGRYYLQGFAKNLENTITLSSATSGVYALSTFAEPRTYGVRAGVNF